MKNITLFLALLITSFGFSQTNLLSMGESSNAVSYDNGTLQTAMRGPCDFLNPDTGIVNGLGMAGTQWMAEDFDVAAGENFSPLSFTFEYLNFNPNMLSSLDIYFFADGGAGTPTGAPLFSILGQAATSQAIIGSAFGRDRIEATYDLSASGVTLAGGAAGTKYWIALVGVSSGGDTAFWSAGTVITGSPCAVTVDSGATWFTSVAGFGANYNAFFNLSGDCLAAVSVCGTGNPQSIPVTGTGGSPCVGGPTTSPANVSAAGVIGTGGGEYTIDNVTIDLTHTWDSDLDITLISPSGTTLDLSSDNGSLGDNYTNTVFMDGAPSITTGSPPFTGTFEAEGGTFAATFAGEPITGDWTLSICDDTGGDSGTLLSFCISLNENPGPIGDPPVISCPMDITAPNDPGICGATVNFTDALAIDTEDGVIPTIQTGGPASGDVFPLGDTVVEFSATDSDGNTSTCSFTVTVEDTEAPVIACQDITVELDASGMYSLTPAEVLGSSTDNCGIDTVSFSVIGDPITECGNAPLPIPATGTSGPMDPSVAAVADSGIIGVDYTFDNVTLNIIHTWANDLDMTLESPSGTVLELSTDNGGSSGLDSAANLVFTDASGNLITGWTGGAPLADYQPEGGLLNSVFDGEDINGNWTLNITDDTGGDSGTLNSFCLSFSPQATAQPTLDLTCANVGANNVTVVVTDEAGNSSTCSAVVTVEDNIAPEIMCIGSPGIISQTEDFEGSTIPAGWSSVITNGTDDWAFGSGDLPIGDDFPTNAAIFDDDAAGNGTVNALTLFSPVYDLTGALSANLSYEVAFQEFGDQEFAVEVWDGATWQQVALYVDGTDPDITPESFDVSAFINADFQVRFAYDDLGGWGWHAAIDNFQLDYELPSSPLVVELDGNGMVTVNAADLLMNVDEACGYTVTTGGGGAPVPGTITTLFATNNGGNSGGAVYFDVTVGPEGLSITDIDVNSNATGAFTMEVYTLEGSYVGNEGNAGAWTLSATGSGTGAGIDQPSNMVLDVPVELMAGTTYGMALVMDSNADHRYTNGDGTNESYSNADLSLQLGAASNTPFDGSPFSPRVWNGTLNYLVGSAPSETIEFDCSNLGVNTVEITVTDDSGNMATCTASVEVIDVTDPVLICQDFTIVLDENGEAVVNPEDLLAQLPTTYEAVVIGSDNGSGTAGTTDFTVPVTDAAAISFDWAYTSNDAPGFDSFGYVLNGVYTQLTDPAQGNQSGTANVNVAPGDVFGYRSQTDDNILGNNETLITNFVPGYTGQFAPENWTLSLNNSDGDAYFIEIPGGPASYDNCGITILATDITDVTCADIGTPITVTVFASDASGNLASCTSIITVVDESGPVIENCPEDQTVDPGPNNLFYELPDYWTTGATATDNCTDPVTLLSQDPAAGTLLPDGTYTITLFAEDEYGNVSECTFELTIESVLGVDDQQLESGVVIYPNPAQGVMNISNSTNIELERAAIYDVNGRLVQNINLSNMATEKAVDVSNLSSGVYMVQIQSNDGQTVKRLVKE